MSKSIIIDPGHGGSDPGANGFGVKEKDWNLRISLYQYDRLKELGAKVGITRTTDRTLSNTERTNTIRNKWDVCVSNHWNAFNGSARGVETIHSYLSNSGFAKGLANAIVKASGLPLRRVFTRRLKSGADYYFMHRLTGSTETVIIEYGFIDNKLDHAAYQKDSVFYAVAEAAIKEICKKIGVSYKAPGTSSVKKPAVPSASLPSGTLYKVQAGSFAEEDGADARYSYLEGKGFDPIIMFNDGSYKVQVGAYGVKDNAGAQLERVRKFIPDAFISVEKGDAPLPKPKPAPKPKANKSIAGAKLVKNEDAYFKATENIKVRNAPDVKATHTGTLPAGASINYKRVFEGNGYRWLEYTGNSGNTLYLPYRPLNTSKSWGTFHSSRPK